MFRRSLPSHGGIATFGSAEPWTGGSVMLGPGVSVGSGASLAPGDPDGDALPVSQLTLLGVADEHALVAERVERDQVVAGDDRVAAGHDEDHREEPGDRDRVEDQLRPAEPPAARGRHRVQEDCHPVGVDRREDAVEEAQDVQHEHRGQDPRRQDSRSGRRAGPADDARAEGDHEIGRRREPEGALVGARVRVPRTGKKRDRNRRDERRACALAHGPSGDCIAG
jgi:hypothetical protein